MLYGCERLGAVAHLIFKVKGCVTLALHALDDTQCTLAELSVVLSLDICPSHLGNSHGAWPQHLLVVLVRHDKLGPEVGLYAENVACILGGDILGYGVVGVDPLQGQVATDRLGLPCGVILRCVDVAVAVGRHYDIVARLGRGNASLLASPRHHRGVGCEASLQYLVPAYYLTSARVEIPLHALYHVAL